MRAFVKENTVVGVFKHNKLQLWVTLCKNNAAIGAPYMLTARHVPNYVYPVVLYARFSLALYVNVTVPFFA